jgi:hypothetical protein
MKPEARQYTFSAEFWTFAFVSTIYLNEGNLSQYTYSTRIRMIFSIIF